MAYGQTTDPAFFRRGVHEWRRLDRRCCFDGIGGRIVEVEAYHHTIPQRTVFAAHIPHAVMFGPWLPYVYRSYGIHWCVTSSASRRARPAPLLIRAIEPTVGYRHAAPARRAMNGCFAPALAGLRALRISQAHNGLALYNRLRAVCAHREWRLSPPRIASPKRSKSRGLRLKGSRFLSNRSKVVTPRT